MQDRTKPLVGALITELALSATFATAQARRFQISEQRFLAIWGPTKRLTFEGAGLINIACAVTLEGSFHSAILSKVSGQLVGYVTSAALTRPCSGGQAWIQNGTEVLPDGSRPTSLPWHIRYNRFIGALPNITQIRFQLSGIGFLVQYAVGECLITSTAASPAFAFVEGAPLGRRLRADEAPTIPTAVTLEGLCGAVGFRGAAEVFAQGAPGLESTRITVRLVK
jgi:hypothetical protein